MKVGVTAPKGVRRRIWVGSPDGPERSVRRLDKARGDPSKGAPHAPSNSNPHLSHQQQHQPQVDVTIGSSTFYTAEKITPQSLWPKITVSQSDSVRRKRGRRSQKPSRRTQRVQYSPQGEGKLTTGNKRQHQRPSSRPGKPVSRSPQD